MSILTPSRQQKPSINLIGAGKAASTLAAAWSSGGYLVIQGVLNRSIESADSAVSFMGEGKAVENIHELEPADITLIGCGDSHIRQCAERLAEARILRKDDIVFHCSGLLASTELDLLHEQGAQLASAHPMMSFADASLAVTALPGTLCGIEGDARAVQRLDALFSQIHCKPFRLEAASKPLYHAAAVFACNYLVTLQEVANLCLEKAGVDATLRRELLTPLIRSTINNLEHHSLAEALTGPIARGDSKTVDAHLAALSVELPDIAELYRSLALQTLPLAQKQGTAKPEQLSLIQAQLDAGGKYE